MQLEEQSDDGINSIERFASFLTFSQFPRSSLDVL